MLRVFPDLSMDDICVKRLPQMRRSRLIDAWMVNEPNVLYLIQDAFEMFTIQLLIGKISRIFNWFSNCRVCIVIDQNRWKINIYSLSSILYPLPPGIRYNIIHTWTNLCLSMHDLMVSTRRKKINITFRYPILWFSQRLHEF